MLNERWEKCIGCQYNGCKKKEDLQDSDYQDFSCHADINDFPCPEIPLLYPYKLSDLKELDNNKESVFDQKVAKNNLSPYYEAFLVELEDSIEYSIRAFVAISDSSNTLKEEIERKLRHRHYRHLRVHNIKKLSAIFENYNVIVLPKNISHVVYPNVDIEMEHGLSKIKMEEMVIDIERFPSFEDEKPTNIKVNMDLSDYNEIETRNIPSAQRKSGNP